MLSRNLALAVLIASPLLLAPASAIGQPASKETPRVDRVGDWIQHRSVMRSDAGLSTTVKQTVVKVDPTEITVDIETVTTVNGKQAPAKKQTVTRSPSSAGTPDVKSLTIDGAPRQAQETIQAADGKSYACTLTEVKSHGKIGKTYRSAELPLGGLVRTEADGKVFIELLAWGRGETFGK